MFQGDDVSDLFKASRRGNLEKVKVIIDETGYHPEQVSLGKPQNTALHYAAGGGALNTLKYFIEDLDWNHSIPGVYKQTPLHTAAQYGQYSIVEYLVRSQSVDPCYVVDEFNRNTLH